MLAAIWAQDEEGLIGKEGKLPWHLPNDLKFFKTMTEHNTIVMGRKTFEGMGGKLLPNRDTIILTSDKSYQVAGALVFHDKQEVLEYAKKTEGTVFITGGTQVYKTFLPEIDVLHRTLIHHSFEGDAYFPKINWDAFTMVSISEGETDERNPYKYQFESYHRK